MPVPTSSVVQVKAAARGPRSSASTAASAGSGNRRDSSLPRNRTHSLPPATYASRPRQVDGLRPSMPSSRGVSGRSRRSRNVRQRAAQSEYTTTGRPSSSGPASASNAARRGGTGSASSRPSCQWYRRYRSPSRRLKTRWPPYALRPETLSPDAIVPVSGPRAVRRSAASRRNLRRGRRQRTSVATVRTARPYAAPRDSSIPLGGGRRPPVRSVRKGEPDGPTERRRPPRGRSRARGGGPWRARGLYRCPAGGSAP